ncbi:hypothetical protein CVT25_011972 [Psilocybe cyanescens]|uniref:Uncharacterized protein n=1 Tax=Psilocybe cyanescens TaxID=93625 RepID=A0A409XH38_PSICY|nr:hypothetical protein CVT25_011972 [Psilocybe cyanescens]
MLIGDADGPESHGAEYVMIGGDEGEKVEREKVDGRWSWMPASEGPNFNSESMVVREKCGRGRGELTLSLMDTGSDSYADGDRRLDGLLGEDAGKDCS